MTSNSNQTEQPHKRKRAVVAIFRRERKILAIRRSQKVVAPGKICFPGGGIEEGESIEEALIREINEELGIQVAPVRELWQSTTPWEIQVHWWLATTAAKQFSPNADEVEWVGWMSPDEMFASSDLLVSNKQFFAALRENQFEL